MKPSKKSFNLNCPLPKLDFDVITLGHGGGGLLTRRLLDAGVFQVLKNEYLNEGDDGAFLKLEGEIAFSTDSFVISPIIFPGGNIGELAVNGTVNDIAMCGAIPQFISLSFIIEEGLKVSDFWEILLGINRACLDAGVKVVTGDTKVVEKGKGDQIFINTTGLGKIHPNAKIHISNVRNGDVIIVSGNIATHGIAILSVREGLEFETALESDTCNLNHMVKALLDECGDSIHFLRDPTRGGLASVLNEISEASKLGIELWQKTFPIDESVEGACEMLGLDPLYVANEGIFIAIVEQEKADQVIKLMNQFDNGKQAAIIGKVMNEHPGQVVLQSAIGGRRVVNMLVGDQLPRIC